MGCRWLSPVAVPIWLESLSHPDALAGRAAGGRRQDEDGTILLTGRHTIDVLLSAWEGTILESLPCAPNTRKVYRARLKMIRRDPQLSQTQICRAAKPAWVLWRDRALAIWAPQTVRDLISLSKLVWDWGHDIGVCGAPWTPIKVKSSRRAPRAPSPAEVHTALDQIEGWPGLALRLQYYLGARGGEVAALRLGDIDDRGHVLILHLGRHVGARKTGVRSIPVVEADLIRAIRDRAADVGDLSADLWPGPTIDSRLQMMRRYLVAIRPDWGLHALRRARTTALYRAGVDSGRAGALQGHSASVAAKHYREIGDQDLQAAMSALLRVDAAPAEVFVLPKANL